MHGPTGILRANLTAFSLKAKDWDCTEAAAWVSQIDGVVRAELVPQFRAELTAKFVEQNVRGPVLLLMEKVSLEQFSTD